jgi:hypothetical protein
VVAETVIPEPQTSLDYRAKSEPSHLAGKRAFCRSEKETFTRRASPKQKTKPFVAGRGAGPSALSRAHGFCVYRSEAGDPSMRRAVPVKRLFPALSLLESDAKALLS